MKATAIRGRIVNVGRLAGMTDTTCTLCGASTISASLLYRSLEEVREITRMC